MRIPLIKAILALRVAEIAASETLATMCGNSMFQKRNLDDFFSRW